MGGVSHPPIFLSIVTMSDYTEFYKRADLSGWADNNIRTPINSWLDRNIRNPIHKGIENFHAEAGPKFQQTVDSARKATNTAATIPAKAAVNYVTNYIPGEIERGRRGFYDPSSLGKQNLWTSYGLVKGGLEDRWNHDYSVNTDGSPNTDVPTLDTFTADTLRNMVRNLSFQSDDPNTYRIPVINKNIKGTTLGNFGALPASLYMTLAGNVPGIKDKHLWQFRTKLPKGLPVAEMNAQQKRVRWGQIEREKVKLYNDFSKSTSKMRQEYEALAKDFTPETRITFNQYYDQRYPELLQEYKTANRALSAQQEEVYPWLNTVYPSSEKPILQDYSTITPMGDIDTYRAVLKRPGGPHPIPSDPRLGFLKMFSRYYPYMDIAVMRANKGGRLNSAEEQLRSFIGDSGGAMANVVVRRTVPLALAGAANIVNPKLGATMLKYAPNISDYWGYYDGMASQYDAAMDALGVENPVRLNPVADFTSQQIYKSEDWMPKHQYKK